MQSPALQQLMTSMPSSARYGGLLFLVCPPPVSDDGAEESTRAGLAPRLPLNTRSLINACLLCEEAELVLLPRV